MPAFRQVFSATLLLVLAGLGRSEEPKDAEAIFDESVLKEQRIPADARGLIEFLKRRSLDEPGRKRVEALIRQLGDKRYALRERAGKELNEIGVPALSYLEKAKTHADEEVAERSRRAVEQIRTSNNSNVSFAVLRSIERRQARDAVLPIIDFLPFADDRYVEEEAFRVLGRTGLADGRPVADLRSHATAKDPLARSAAGYLLGRSRDAEHRLLARKLLADPEAWVQLRAAQGLLAGQDKTAIAALIALLDRAPEAVVWQAEEALRGLAQDRAPAPLLNDDGAARQEYRKSWEKWWREQEPAIELAKIPLERTTRGLTLGIEYNTNSVWECGLDGKRRWTISNAEGPMDAQILPGERVLIAEQSAHRVTERDLQGKIIWEKKIDEEPINARRLPNGNTFIGTRHKVMEVRPNGAEVFSYHLSTEYLHAVRRLPSGGFLGISNTGKILEVDPAGKTTRTIELQNEGSWGDVEALPGGRYLVTNYGSGFLREIDAKGNKLREILCSDPCGVQLQPDGKVLVCGTGRVAVVDWNAKTLWEAKSDGCVRRAFRR